MYAPVETRATLLVRLRDPLDQEAWRQFAELYARLIYDYARSKGLQDHDAADLMQEVLQGVSRSIGRWDYDPKKGSFRGWLYRIVRNKLVNFLESRRHNRAMAAGDSNIQQQLEQHAAPEGEAEDWDREYQRKAFAWAAEQVREEFQISTWQAFWLTAVEGVPVKEVSERLNLSAGAIYVARSRVLSRLRERVEELEDINLT
jgi:RNA polymerase sigma factor (sigma-70 family)